MCVSEFKQYMACLFVGVCKSVPVCSDLWLALVQFLFDKILEVVYMAE